jgi:hypothetical protein
MMPRVSTLALLALLVAAPALEAQGPPGPRPPGGGRPLRVDARQALSFGALLPGVPTVVPSNDALNAANVEIRGAGGSDVLISFLLPTQLDGPAGAGVPLTFGVGSAGYSPSQDINAQIALDPQLSEVLQLPVNGRGTVYLGGVASPPTQISAGTYGATITVTLSYVGS